MIIVSRFNYIDINVTENRNIIPLDLKIMLGPYKFNPNATLDHHVHHELWSLNGFSSLHCCGKNDFGIDTTITECNINHTHNSLTACILLYRLVVECPWQNRGGWELITSHDAGTDVCPFNTGRGIVTETHGVLWNMQLFIKVVSTRNDELPSWS